MFVFWISNQYQTYVVFWTDIVNDMKLISYNNQQTFSLLTHISNTTVPCKQTKLEYLAEIDFPVHAGECPLVWHWQFVRFGCRDKRQVLPSRQTPAGSCALSLSVNSVNMRVERNRGERERSNVWMRQLSRPWMENWSF